MSTENVPVMPIEHDAAYWGGQDHYQEVNPNDIATCVVFGRTAEFFEFFIYAIASIIIIPRLLFPFAPPVAAMLSSFAIFALAYIARPLGTVIFTAVDRGLGRGVKLGVATVMLGVMTIGIAFVPGYESAGAGAIIMLAVLRIGQGLAMGGTWDGLASLLALSAPEGRRGWYAMIPQLGAFLGLLGASAVYGVLASQLSPQDLLAWGWRYPFVLVVAINMISVFTRLRISETPTYAKIYANRDLRPTPVGETFKRHGGTIIIGAFVSLASFAPFHLVTVFPFSWIVLFSSHDLGWFLTLQAQGAAIGVIGVVASGLLSDHLGRRRLLALTAIAIAAFSAFAPSLLDGGVNSITAYMLIGFALLGVSFGQASGAIAANFPSAYRYTGSALTTDLGWLFGAGFAPFVALLLASQFGLMASGIYLFSGALCTLIALALNHRLAGQILER